MIDNTARLMIADRDLLIARARIRELEDALVTAEARGRDAMRAEMEATWQPVLADVERRVRAEQAECCGQE
jgi:hypothetical protein